MLFFGLTLLFTVLSCYQKAVWESEPGAAVSWSAQTCQKLRDSPVYLACPIIVQYRKNPANRPDPMLFYLAALLLVHDTEPNPGPLPRDSSDSTICPCGYCKEPVTWAEKGVCCDSCEVWYHHTCQNLRSTIYEHMDTSSCSWHCLTCGMPNFGTTLFNTTKGLQLTGDDFETTDSSQHRSRTCSSIYLSKGL